MSQHLKEINETYLEHLQFAQKMGWSMIISGLACIIHSLFPDILKTTGSNAIKKLDQAMTERKNKKSN